METFRITITGHDYTCSFYVKAENEQEITKEFISYIIHSKDEKILSYKSMGDFLYKVEELEIQATISNNDVDIIGNVTTVISKSWK